MAKQAPILFLEDWLRSSASNSSSSDNSSRNLTDSSAQMIIQAWAELRDCLQKGAFHPRLLPSLKSFVNSKGSLYVADPQAKLLISVLSSPNISLPDDSHPLILKLLYIWVRKSSKPSLALIDLVVEVIVHLFSHQFDAKINTSLFAEGVLLAGAICLVPSLTGNTKTVCLKLVCRLLEEHYQLIGPVGELVPDVLAGIGYALSSSGELHFVRLLNFLLRHWVTIEVPNNISHALIILHLIEWVVFRFISASASDRIRMFSSQVLENPKPNYASIFAILMATAGALRASNRPMKHGERLNVVVSRLRTSAESQLGYISSNLISKLGACPCSNNIIEDAQVRFLLHCLSLAASRSGGFNSTSGPLLLSLALALLIEVFPLKTFYSKILESPIGNFGGLVKKHQQGILFKEAGAATGVFCNLYAYANEKDKCRVEDLVWSFCHDVYRGHRQVALLLQGRSDKLLNDLEKIAE